MKRSRQRQSRACFTFLVTAFLGAVCLAGIVLLVGFGLIPQMANDAFGAPRPDLPLIQRTYLSLQLLIKQDALTLPVNPEGQPIQFLIREGETANTVATRLYDAGLIRDREAFRAYLIYSGRDTRIRAGSYTLSAAMNALEIAGKLQDPLSQEVAFNILPGWRAEEIAASLATSGLNVDAQTFLEVVRRGKDGEEPLDSYEGFLFPGSYRFLRDVTAEEMVQAFYHEFERSVTDDLRNAYAQRGLSLVEAVTLASIVQREAVVTEEQPLIASVFYNRLQQNMKLDSDPTVQYALGYGEAWGTWWKVPLTLDDLNIDSPYNTYLYPGLPPTPICNPGLSALQAVAYPAETPYLYFRAACDGSGRHQFARTFDEHLQNACP
jgi:UPF0755 protein